MILFYFFLFHFQDIIHSVFVHSFTFFVFPSQIPPLLIFFPLYSLLFSPSTFPFPLSLSLLSLLHFFSLYIFSLLPLSPFPLHLKLFVVNLLPPIFFPSLVFYSRSVTAARYLLFAHTMFAFLKYRFFLLINRVAVCVSMSTAASRQVRHDGETFARGVGPIIYVKRVRGEETVERAEARYVVPRELCSRRHTRNLVVYRNRFLRVKTRFFRIKTFDRWRAVRSFKNFEHACWYASKKSRENRLANASGIIGTQ